ncbi:ACP S-malonyltransferase [Paenibacillus sp. EKM211P]|uniref:ACP S-malonyltransferase n=1 Tax=Paenibacillus sp. EKM211P TaxID=1683679 RepID=UPI0013E99BFC|nr:ACP S-malonyltransferase [Paenibacillus sp. EKM211P]KAF6582680.1 ACP S-malonyltransferase [Paenibacillus sp. EKM211P]
MIAFVFPGQGSQTYRMGEHYIKEMPELKKYYDEASDILGRNLYAAVFGDRDNFLVRDEDIQPALFVNGFIAYEYFKQTYECVPAYMAGHSLGEITALAASGTYRFADGIRMVDKRGQLMKEGCRKYPGVMTSVSQCDLDAVKAYCGQRDSEQIAVAALNSRSQIVLSGSLQEIELLENYFTSRGVRIKRLNTIGAFHSQFMKEASATFKQFLQTIEIQTPQIPVICNVTARQYANKHDVIELLSMQMIHTVQWDRIIQYFESHFVDMIVDAGPNGILKNLIKKDRRKCKAYDLDAIEDRNRLEKVLSRQKAPKHKLCELITLCLCAAVSTPTLTPNLEMEGASHLYQELWELQEQVSSAFYSDDLVRQAFNKISLLLKSKGYRDKQIKEIVTRIRQESGLLQTKESRWI